MLDLLRKLLDAFYTGSVSYQEILAASGLAPSAHGTNAYPVDVDPVLPQTPLPPLNLAYRIPPDYLGMYGSGYSLSIQPSRYNLSQDSLELSKMGGEK